MFFNLRSIWWLPLFIVVVIAAAILVPIPAFTQAEVQTEPVLVIDAGHGGADGGAIADDGTLESGINLDIALRLESLADFWGVETEMTRRSDDIAYPADATTLSAMKKADQYARVSMINSTPGAILISIHQNKYPSVSPHGPQVFYGSAEGSDALAAIVQANLTGQLCPSNRRGAKPIDEDIFLMRKVRCTAVLTECGFMSNPDELAKLKTPNYRLQLASIFLASYLEYIRGTAT